MACRTLTSLGIQHRTLCSSKSRRNLLNSVQLLHVSIKLCSLKGVCFVCRGCDAVTLKFTGACLRRSYRCYTRIYKCLWEKKNSSFLYLLQLWYKQYLYNTASWFSVIAARQVIPAHQGPHHITTACCYGDYQLNVAALSHRQVWVWRCMCK